MFRRKQEEAEQQSLDLVLSNDKGPVLITEVSIEIKGWIERLREKAEREREYMCGCVIDQDLCKINYRLLKALNLLLCVLKITSCEHY